ncbi:MAG: cytochrome C [Acidiferrobacteraceae bacterium]|jgi:cytochrome c|nr:cytochrome C [Acidiferrobacteraceae bacterium]MDP6312930.1 c-type cytochrome [Arenicellales bacterium]HJP45929.1 c-type cytochrome [Arenicellales bacterium]|tara:strand:- start:118 stop:480 length:363 start_codon:yes stop_codon:yes gene_type:complete
MIEFIAKDQHGKSMRNIVMATCFAACLSVSLPAFSDDGAALYASRGCIGCHGAGGNAPVAPNYPKIGMQNKEYTVNQLTDYKNNKRSNGLAALMVGMVAALTEEDIQKLAEYLSANTGAD